MDYSKQNFAQHSAWLLAPFFRVSCSKIKQVATMLCKTLSYFEQTYQLITKQCMRQFSTEKTDENKKENILHGLRKLISIK